MNNAEIAIRFLEYARSISRAQLYRARAYRMAAFVIQGLGRPVEEILNLQGRSALAEIPGIGHHLAFTLETLVTTGEFVPYSERKRRRMPLDRVA